ncbi:hypothetical protein ABT112_27940 [Streptomyces sp. NPDC002055]|uniref:hypothetical protein n=1 Tax=Streptomyces sp. NPDC002055 TaxID=3154534 RepID=UPI00332CF8F8
MTRNAARLRRGARVLVPLLGAVTLTAAITTSAAANPAAVVRVGAQVRLAALPGETNAVTFSATTGNLIVTDSVSLTAGPGCTTVTANSADCGPAGTLTSIRAALGDGNDSAVTTDEVLASVLLDGGRGQDSIDGGGGNDRLYDSDGWPSAPTQPSFSGGPGNDVIVALNGGYDNVDCGPGVDTVLADAASQDVLTDCEVVQRL